MTKIIFIVVGVLTLVTVSPRAQDTTFWDNRQEGYWFYIDPTEEEFLPPPEPETVPPTPATPTQSTSDDMEKSIPMSAAWLREQLPLVMDKALDSGDVDDVALYLFMQKAAMDKSSRFADNFRRVTSTYPMLDENERRPISTAGGRILNQVAKEKKTKIAEDLSQSLGIWFFYSSTCSYCEPQAKILEALERLYRYEVMAISMDGFPLNNGSYPDYQVDSGHSAQLAVTTTPTLILVNSETGELAKIGEGFQTLDSLIDKIIYHALDHQWITEDEYIDTLPITTLTMLSDNSLEKLQQTDSDEEIFNKIKEMIQETKYQGGLYE